MKLKCILFLITILAPTSLLSNTLYFPQVAVGGGYTTTILVMNTGTTNISGGSLTFYDQLGIGHSEYTHSINLPAGGSSRFTLTSTGPLMDMSGLLSTVVGTLQGVATFDLRSSNGTLITTAGVLAVAAGNSFLLPVDLTSTASTGVAIANASAGPVNVSLQLFDESGSQVATANDARLNPLGYLRQVADFVTSMFPQLLGTTFKGTLIVSAAAGAPVNSLAVTALTVKEGLLSALPVIPVTPSSGSSGGPSGSATADVVFEYSLLGGSSLQFQGQTFITVGSNPLLTFHNIAPGTYDITGTVGAFGSVIVGFANGGGLFGTGGVVPGSLQSVQGPSGPGALISACSATYTNVGSSSQPFDIRFMVTTSTTAACQTGQ